MIELRRIGTKSDGTPIFGSPPDVPAMDGFKQQAEEHGRPFARSGRARVHAAPQRPIVGLDALLGALANGD